MTPGFSGGLVLAARPAYGLGLLELTRLQYSRINPGSHRNMTIVAVFNQKGGVGKTTTALNLAAALARRGRQPVGIDLDPQAQFGSITGIAVHSGDDSVFSLFQRNRPLHELIQKSASGISVIPSHAE